MQTVDLLVIDAQYDFCDQKGALYVKGADDDMNRLADMIRKESKRITNIHLTLDSHHQFDIAHPYWFRDSQGKHPNPFTIIGPEDLEQGVWMTTRPQLFKRTLQYLKDLQSRGRYPHCIWPPHCLIGSPGYAIYEPVREAIFEWERKYNTAANKITKGSNIFTEHFSAVQAEVPDPEDPSTQLNTDFIDTVEKADIILLAGEAGSHCLANTVRDMANNFKDDSYIHKLILLEDATSPVPSFEKNQEDFISELTARGMQISKTSDPFAVAHVV